MTTFRRKGRSGRATVLVLSLGVLAALLVVAPGTAGAGTPDQARHLLGQDRPGCSRSRLPPDPVHREQGEGDPDHRADRRPGLCLSTDVFTQDGTTSKKLGRNRKFTITHTFFGNKIDKIHGQFVSSTEVEGYAIYHFFAQDLCLRGQDQGQLQREAQVAARPGGPLGDDRQRAGLHRAAHLGVLADVVAVDLDRERARAAVLVRRDRARRSASVTSSKWSIWRWRAAARVLAEEAARSGSACRAGRRA